MSDNLDDINKSLKYALKIQESLIPDINTHQKFKGSFSIDKPLDIIGGDFYLHKKLLDGRCMLIMGDCTGHGVPGALLSILTITKIQNIIESYKHSEITPSKILYTLNESYKTSVIWESDRPITDGVEISIVIFNNNEMLFSSGGGSIIVGGDNHDFKIVKGGKSRINDFMGGIACFEDIKLDLPKFLFMYTDGSHDVFNIKNKKLGTYGLLKCVSESENDDLHIFKENLTTSLKQWFDIVDDNTIIGFKLK